jgi:hypothetical protein
MPKSAAIRIVIGTGILLCGAPALAQSEATAQSTARTLPNANQYICTFAASVSASAVRAETNKAVGPELGQVLFTYTRAIKGFAVRLPASASAITAEQRLKANNVNVQRCERDGIVRGAGEPAVGKPGGAGGGGGPKQSVPWGVQRVGRGDGSLLTARAWVIDSGIDLTHPDLNVDAADGASFLASDSSLNDTNGHGTHVAGIIGAKDNKVGVVGVASGVRVVPLRVLDGTGSGPDSGVIAALDYLMQYGTVGDVANLSLVADVVSATMDQAVINAGAAGFSIVIAAGNSSANAANYSPGRANGTNVYTVSAFASGDSFASFSNYGNPPIDWSEPGVGIKSSYKGGGYTTLSGTSMAAPHLAGLLLLKGGSAPNDGGAVTGDPDGNADRIGVK